VSQLRFTLKYFLELFNSFVLIKLMIYWIRAVAPIEIIKNIIHIIVLNIKLDIIWLWTVYMYYEILHYTSNNQMFNTFESFGIWFPISTNIFERHILRKNINRRFYRVDVNILRSFKFFYSVPDTFTFKPF